MNEIKFRAWDKRNEFMLVHNKIANISFKYECLHYDSVPPEKLSDIDFKGDLYTDKNGIHIDVYFNDIILMQYIGIQDKNKKDIYDGDILYSKGELINIQNNKRTGEYKETYRAVRWMENKSCFTSDGIMNMDSSIIKEYCEIVGNICENPELLEKK